MSKRAHPDGHLFQLPIPSSPDNAGDVLVQHITQVSGSISRFHSARFYPFQNKELMKLESQISKFDSEILEGGPALPSPGALYMVPPVRMRRRGI
jgi:hypothetical protein